MNNQVVETYPRTVLMLLCPTYYVMCFIKIKNLSMYGDKENNLKF